MSDNKLIIFNDLSDNKKQNTEQWMTHKLNDSSAAQLLK